MDPIKHPALAMGELSRALKAYCVAFSVDNVKSKKYSDELLNEMLHTVRHLEHLQQEFNLISLQNESESRSI